MKINQYFKYALNITGVLFRKQYLIVVSCSLDQFEYLLDFLISSKNYSAPFLGEFDKEKKIIHYIKLRKSFFSRHASQISKQKITYLKKNNNIIISISFNEQRDTLVMFFIFMPLIISINLNSFSLYNFILYCSIYYLVSLIFLFHHFIYIVNSRIKHFFKKQNIDVIIKHNNYEKIEIN
jgi:hypothetical protein